MSRTNPVELTFERVIYAGDPDDTTLPVASWSTSGLSVNETQATGLAMTVTLDKVAQEQVVVPFTVNRAGTDTATRGVDYEIRQTNSLSGVVQPFNFFRIPAGSQSATLYYAPIINAQPQPPEIRATFTIDNQAVQGNNVWVVAGCTIGSPQVLTVIQATTNTAAPVVRFRQASSSHTETDATSTASVGLELNIPAPSGGCSVTYTKSPSSSSRWTDLTGGTVSFAAGETQKTINIQVNGDTSYTGNETLTLTLATPTNCTLGTQTGHVLTIVEDETDPGLTVPSVGFGVTSVNATEGGRQYVVPLQVFNAADVLPSATNPRVTVSVGGTAQSGTHYALGSNFGDGLIEVRRLATDVDTGISTWGGGFTVTFPDNTDPASTLLTFTLSGPLNCTLQSGATQLTINIADDGDVGTGGYDPDGVDDAGNLDYTGAALAPKREQIAFSDPHFTIHPDGLFIHDGTGFVATTNPWQAFMNRYPAKWQSLNAGLYSGLAVSAAFGSENVSVRVRLSNTLGATSGQTQTIRGAPGTYGNRVLLMQYEPSGGWLTQTDRNGYRVLRDVVFYGEGQEGGNQLTDVATVWIDAVPDGFTGPRIVDNLRWERVRFLHEINDPQSIRCFMLPKFPTQFSGDETNSHGTIKLYDCRVDSSADPVSRTRQGIWAGARANWDIRNRPGLAYAFGGQLQQTAAEHYLYLYSVQPAGGKGNYFIGLTNDVAGANGDGLPNRTFIQIPNRPGDAPGKGTNGSIVFLNCTSRGIGKGDPQGTAWTVWGNNGRTYVKNVRHEQGGQASVCGGFALVHDYGYSSIDHPRGIYPLELETGRFYTSDELVIDGFTCAASNLGGRHVIECCGVQTLRLIKFDNRAITSAGAIAGQFAMNRQQGSQANVPEGFFAGVSFTKQVIVSGLKHPDTGTAYSSALSAYPGWGAGTKVQDGYHQNWWQDVGNLAVYDNDAVDDWVAIVAEQYLNRLDSGGGDGLGTVSHADWTRATTPTLPTVSLEQDVLNGLYVLEREQGTGEQVYSLAANWSAASQCNLRVNYEVTATGVTEGTHYILGPTSPAVAAPPYGADDPTSYAVTVWPDGVQPSRLYRKLFNLRLQPTGGSASGLATGTKTLALTLTDGGTRPEIEYPQGSGTWVELAAGSNPSDSLNVIPWVDRATLSFGSSGYTIPTTDQTLTIPVTRGGGNGNLDALNLPSQTTIVHAAASGSSVGYVLQVETANGQFATGNTLNFAPGETTKRVRLVSINNAMDQDSIVLRLFESTSNPVNAQAGSFGQAIVTLEGPTTGGGSTRHDPNAVVDYVFAQGADPNTVYDLKANPLNLTIGNNAVTTWGTDGTYDYLNIAGGDCAITSAVAATKLYSEIGASDAAGGGFTVEVWCRPASINTYPASTAGNGPLRLVDLQATDGSERSFMLGQGKWGGVELDSYRARVKTPTTDADGFTDTTTGTGVADIAIQHVVMSYQVGVGIKVWVNTLGDTVVSSPRVVDADHVDSISGAWARTNRLRLGGSWGSDRHFEGRLYRVTIHSEAFTDALVAQNFASGPAGDGVLPPPAVSWESTTTLQILEWDEDGLVQIPLSIVPPPSQSITVPVTLTASGGDTRLSFLNGASLLTANIPIQAGEGTKNVRVFVTNDGTDQGDASWIINIGQGTGYTTSGQTFRTLSVVDDDTPPVVSFTSSTLNVSDGAGVVNVGLSSSRPFASAVDVSLAFTGTASSGTHYTAPASVTFPAHATSVNLPITVLASGLTGSVTLTSTINSLSAGTIGSPAAHVITVNEVGSAGSIPYGTGTVPSASGSGTQAICQPCVYPYEELDGIVRLGCIADHIDNISSVEISLGGAGSPLSVTERTFNPRTGIWEYCGDLDCSTVPSSGTYTLYFEAIPTSGRSRVMSRTVYVHKGAVPAAVVRYASPNGTGSGASTSDPANMTAALNAAQTANGGTLDGVVIRMMAGIYTIPASNSWSNTTRWVTLEAAPGQQVTIGAWSDTSFGLGRNVKLQKRRNMIGRWPGVFGATGSASTNSDILITRTIHQRSEQIQHIGVGVVSTGTAGNPGFHSPSFPWAYNSESDCYYTLCKVALDGMDWSHSCTQYEVLSEGSKFTSLVTNLTSNDHDVNGSGNAAGWHADLLVWSGGSDENFVVSGAVIRNCFGQPIWFSHGGVAANQTWKDSLLENLVVEKAPGNFKSGWGNGGWSTFNHQLWRHVTWANISHYWKDNTSAGPATAANFNDVLYDACVFGGSFSHENGSGPIGDVTLRDCHFSVAGNASGSGATTGAPQWDGNYYPTAGGNLTGVTIDVVPHDAENNERGPTTTAKGGLRATDETL